MKLNGSSKWAAAIVTLAVFAATGIYGYGALAQSVKTEAKTNEKQDATIEKVKEKNNSQDLAIREFTTKQEQICKEISKQEKAMGKMNATLIKIGNKLGVE